MKLWRPSLALAPQELDASAFFLLVADLLKVWQLSLTPSDPVVSLLFLLGADPLRVGPSLPAPGLGELAVFCHPGAGLPQA